MPSSTASKNILLAHEVSIFKNSIIIPLAEAHRYLHNLGTEFVHKSANIVSLSKMLDAVTGDNRITDYIGSHSKLGFIEKEHKNLNKIFPRFPLDISDIEAVFYDAIEAVESLLGVLTDLFSKGRDEFRKVIIMLNDFINRLKKTVLDTALKVYMHTKIEMIIKTQQNLRVA